uniref:Uncharacterized protein n=1 Tax=viral metagenome TaxID=1070528 RepID=A0A6M3JRP2_9ZZZZ
MKGRKRKLESERKRRRKTAAYTASPADRAGRKRSKYARKHDYLARVQLWGFQVPEPKPWKGGNT